jgi:hypothetical protein
LGGGTTGWFFVSLFFCSIVHLLNHIVKSHYSIGKRLLNLWRGRRGQLGAGASLVPVRPSTVRSNASHAGASALSASRRVVVAMFSTGGWCGKWVENVPSLPAAEVRGRDGAWPTWW